jgi:spore germination protein YaaH
MKVSAWLRMATVGGLYPLPTSEASYNLHKSSIDKIYPTHGGTFQADGSILQQPAKLSTPFAIGLRAQALAEGQLYMPSIGGVGAIFDALLNDPAAQIVAVNNLITLATTRTVDAPWDGVMFDFEGFSVVNKNKASIFITMLSVALHTVGMKMAIWMGASHHSYDTLLDYVIVGSEADYVEAGYYDFWEHPAALEPYWWIQACIEFAISSGIPHNKFYPCLGIYNAYYYDLATPHWYHAVTYAQANTLTTGYTVAWEESRPDGLMRAYHADMSDPAHFMYFTDSNSVRLRLKFREMYDLAGISFFILGGEDDLIWNELNPPIKQKETHCEYCPCEPNAWMWCTTAYLKMIKARYPVPY